MVTTGLGEAQEKRVAKAIRLENDLVWTKAPNGWAVTTPSGATYLVTERGECSCPDHKFRCCGSELRCFHVIALRRKLMRDAEKNTPPMVADTIERAARLAREDVIFDRIFGG